MVLLSLLVLPGFLSRAPLCGAEERDRSPIDLVLAPDETWLAVANRTAGSVSLVTLPGGQVVQELPVGAQPVALALAEQGRTLLVTCHSSGDLVLLQVQGQRLVEQARLALGMQPYGIAVSPTGERAYVALTAAAQVAEVDLAARKVLRKFDVGRWPRLLTISPDGARLAVGASGDRGVTLVDVPSGKQVLHDAFVGLNIGQLVTSKDGQHAYFPWMVYRGFTPTAGNIRLGWVLASRIARIRFDGSSRRESMSLDPPGKAIADPYGFALTSDDSRIVCAASGTQELLVYRATDLPLSDVGSNDHGPPEVLRNPERFFRISLGGRPMGLRIAQDDRTVYVANYLTNSIQQVDLTSRAVTRELFLGGPKEPSLARRGEAVFYDARRSLDQWYSCHTCHYEGGTNSVRMDTLNDGSALTPKTVLPLYRLPATAPWTWHGWQTDLRGAMKKSLTETMLGPAPTEDDVDALLAYFATVQPPANPHRTTAGLSPAARRGEALFRGAKANCSACHKGPHFTDGEVHDVGLGSASDRYQGYSTPSLRDVYLRVQLFHDARSTTLRDALAGPHSPEKVAGEAPLTEAELSDLVEYLLTL